MPDDKVKSTEKITQDSSSEITQRKDNFVKEMTALLKSQASAADAAAALKALQQEMSTVAQQIADLQYVIAKIGQDLLVQLETKK
jgi:hypothetical protein